MAFNHLHLLAFKESMAHTSVSKSLGKTWAYPKPDSTILRQVT